MSSERARAIAIRCQSPSRVRGVTLLELVVVLAILTTLGTVILTQTTGLAGEARYTQTVRTLEQVQDAVIGRQPFVGEDPTAVPPGFVADIGRLPQIGVSGNLAELFDPAAAGTALPQFALTTVIGDSALRIPSGWRGPYVRLPVGRADLRDGWGRAFTLEDPSGVIIDPLVAPVTTEVGSVVSLGVGTGDAFDVDLDGVVFLDPVTRVSEGNVVVRLDLADLSSLLSRQRVLVRVYGPRDGVPTTLAQWPEEGTTWPRDPSAAADPGFDPDFDGSIEFENLTIGPRYLRVYRFDFSTGPPLVPALAEDVDMIGAQDVARSTVRRFTVQSGGTSVSPNLEVP